METITKRKSFNQDICSTQCDKYIYSALAVQYRNPGWKLYNSSTGAEKLKKKKQTKAKAKEKHGRDEPSVNIQECIMFMPS